MQPTSRTGPVALHSTDCIHFLIICCISLMDGILKRSFSNLVPQGILLAAKAPRFEADAVKIALRGEAVPRGTTSLGHVLL